MADKASIARMRDIALERLTTATNIISQQMGIDPAALPEFNRDRDYLHAAQLQALAAWAEGVASALPTPQLTIEGATDGNQTEAKNKRPRR